MILLRRVVLLTPDRLGCILDHQDLLIHDRERVGVLAPSGSGRSSIARIICGSEDPHSGKVFRTGRVSWPLGYAGFLHPDLTPRRNIEHLCGLTGFPPEPVLRIASWLCLDRSILDRPVASLTPSQRGLVAEACGLGFPADHYVADEKLLFGKRRRKRAARPYSAGDCLTRDSSSCPATRTRSRSGAPRYTHCSMGVSSPASL